MEKSVSRISDIAIIGDPGRVVAAKGILESIAPVATYPVDDATLASNVSYLRTKIRSFYDIDGIVGKAKRFVNRFRAVTGGRVVLVCDRTFSQNPKLFEDAIASFRGIPSMFVLVVPLENLHTRDIACASGFDQVIEYSKLSDLSHLVERHFSTVFRNRLTAFDISRSMLWFVAATIATAWLSQHGRNLATGTTSSNYSDTDNASAEVVATAEILPSISLTDDGWNWLELYIVSDTDIGRVLLRNDVNTWDADALPDFLYIREGVTRLPFRCRTDQQTVATELCVNIERNSNSTILVLAQDAQDP